MQKKDMPETLYVHVCGAVNAHGGVRTEDRCTDLRSNWKRAGGMT